MELNLDERKAHSSGPWAFEAISDSNRKDIELTDDARFWITGGPLDEVLATVHAPVHGDREEANARVMAAAPGLLAALKVLYAYTLRASHFFEGTPEFAVARAAIAKAEAPAAATDDALDADREAAMEGGH